MPPLRERSYLSSRLLILQSNVGALLDNYSKKYKFAHFQHSRANNLPLSLSRANETWTRNEWSPNIINLSCTKKFTMVFGIVACVHTCCLRCHSSCDRQSPQTVRPPSVSPTRCRGVNERCHRYVILRCLLVGCGGQSLLANRLGTSTRCGLSGPPRWGHFPQIFDWKATIVSIDS